MADVLSWHGLYPGHNGRSSAIYPRRYSRQELRTLSRKKPMITVRNLRFRSLAIDELALGPGTTTILGLNGSGKTNFLKLCTGIWVPESGSIFIDGDTPRDIETGWLNEFPDRNTLFIRVADEIASPLMFRHVPCETVRERVRECTDELGIAHLLHRNVCESPAAKKFSWPLLQPLSTSRGFSCWTNMTRTLMLPNRIMLIG